MDFCSSLHSGAVSLECGLGNLRGIDVEIGLEAENIGRMDRIADLKEVIVSSPVSLRIGNTIYRKKTMVVVMVVELGRDVSSRSFLGCK